MRRRFYLVFTINGLFLAEACSWSDPKRLYSPLDFALLWTVYGVYYLFAGSYLIRTGRRKDRRKVYAFGALFGLYEFPITKVYFMPDGLYVRHVSLINVLRIGFFRHAIMSFTLPFYITLALTGNLEEEHARKVLNRGYLLAAFMYSIAAGTFKVDPIKLVLHPPLYFLYLYLALPKDRIPAKVAIMDERKPLALIAFFYSLHSIIWRRERRPKDPRAYLLALAFLIITLAMIKFSSFKERIREGSWKPKKSFLAIPLVYFELLGVSLYLIALIAYSLIYVTFAFIALLSPIATLYLRAKKR